MSDYSQSIEVRAAILAEKMQKLLNMNQNEVGYRDLEMDHVKADALLVKELRALGYDRAMDLYEAMDKWYA